MTNEQLTVLLYALDALRLAVLARDYQYSEMKTASDGTMTAAFETLNALLRRG